VSDDKSEKIIGLRLGLSTCPHGSLHVTSVEPIHESAVVYSAPDADEVLTGASRVGGGSRLYNENWERMFGAAEDTN
jgi:hypothetical protein